jgi:hypothetical protein
MFRWVRSTIDLCQAQMMPRGRWVLVGTAFPVVALLALVALQLANGVPFRQVFRLFADNSYALEVSNDTSCAVTLYVGFERNRMFVEAARNRNGRRRRGRVGDLSGRGR